MRRPEGAIGLFESKYGEKVKMYTMGTFSKEICGGPHAENTGDLVSFTIQKEESSSAGVRRIKAVHWHNGRVIDFHPHGSPQARVGYAFFGFPLTAR